MIKILEFIENLKDWQILLIGVALIIMGLYLNPFRLAGSMTFEEYKIYYSLSAQDQRYHDTINYIKFGVIAFGGMSSMLIGGNFIGDWMWRKTKGR